MKKRWPAFELEQAQDLARCHGKTVFYVKYGDLGDKVTPEVKQVLDSDIYIEWPEGVRNQKCVDHFFDRLVGGIRGEQIGNRSRDFRPRSKTRPSKKGGKLQKHTIDDKNTNLSLQKH